MHAECQTPDEVRAMPEAIREAWHVLHLCMVQLCQTALRVGKNKFKATEATMKLINPIAKKLVWVCVGPVV